MTATQLCACGCGGRPKNYRAAYIRGHRPPVTASEKREYDAQKARTRRARNKEKAFDPGAPWHGTTNGYDNRCCRCDRCRTAARERSNEWRKRPGVAEHIRARARVLAKRPDQVLRKKAYQYGIDAQTLGAYLADRVCFACGATDVSLSVDHDHSCCPSFRKVCGDCVRGLLCHECNKALGLVHDDIGRLRNLIDYLERWEAKRASRQA